MLVPGSRIQFLDKPGARAQPAEAPADAPAAPQGGGRENTADFDDPIPF